MLGECISTITYQNKLGKPVLWRLYPLKCEKIYDWWPESGQRSRKWVCKDDLAALSICPLTQQHIPKVLEFLSKQWHVCLIHYYFTSTHPPRPSSTDSDASSNSTVGSSSSDSSLWTSTRFSSNSGWRAIVYAKSRYSNQRYRWFARKIFYNQKLSSHLLFLLTRRRQQILYSHSRTIAAWFGADAHDVAALAKLHEEQRDLRGDEQLQDREKSLHVTTCHSETPIRKRSEVGAWIMISSTSETFMLLTVRTSPAAGMFSSENVDSWTFMIASSLVWRYWIALHSRSGRIEIAFGACSLSKRTELRTESKRRMWNILRTPWRQKSSKIRLYSASLSSIYNWSHKTVPTFIMTDSMCLTSLKMDNTAFEPTP